MVKNWLLSFSFLLSIYTVKSQTITTIAGTGIEGYNGDNIAASIAQLYRPAGVTVDNSGNVLIADFMNNRVRRITKDGFISTIGGTGITGYNGDNISATIANLFSPVAIAADQSGNIYIEDGNNNRIRKINNIGFISTLAGTGIYGYNGDNIQSATAKVNYPTDGIMVDGSGNVYFSDTYNHRVRMINNTNGIITTIAGTGVAGYNGDGIDATTAQLNYPYGLALDTAGNIYVADGANNRIRKISKSGIISTVAGTGTGGFNADNILAISSNLNSPTGVVVDKANNIFIADSRNSRVRKVDVNGFISTIAGTGTASYNGDNIPAALATLNYPNGLALDGSGNLLIADLGNSRVRKVTNIAVLPLHLIKFTGALQNGNILLQWQTENEISTKSFNIERSSDGILFTEIGKVQAINASGVNNYGFTDPKIILPIAYYRLKMIDKDDKYVYSNILSFEAHNLVQASLIPNPANSSSTLSFTTSYVGKYRIEITNFLGQMINHLTGVATVGLNTINLDVHNYANGVYNISIVDAENTRTNLKFVKN